MKLHEFLTEGERPDSGVPWPVALGGARVEMEWEPQNSREGS
jgi:hypothetical protein